MTFEQCVKLKEMGFPQNKSKLYWVEYGNNYIDFYDKILDSKIQFANPTAEEALAWVNKKLISRIVTITNDNVNIIYYQANFEFNKCFDTLSDAVYALIVWSYENKLLNK